MMRATKEKSAMCRVERRANKYPVIQEDQDSTLTETSHSSFCCKGLNPNSAWLKQKRDFID